jgi:outer membrane protein OmpA-like peptidoglycan-associated protein
LVISHLGLAQKWSINFPTASSEITSDIVQTLDSIVHIIRKDTLGMTGLFIGHTDSVGNIKYNQNLSEERAGNTFKYIHKRAI